MGTPVPISFPTSTEPSANPTENGGRLINAFAEAAPAGSRSSTLYRRAPGLTNIGQVVGTGAFRGALLVGSVLYVANAALVYTLTYGGGVFTVSALSGTLPGSGPVQMERNMRSPEPQVIILHSAGMSEIDVSAGTIADYSPGSLPAPNSIAYMDSYFFFGIGDGRCFSSADNDDTVSGTDFVTAEAAPDGLVRVVANGRDLLLMGESTIEFYSDTGNPTGFPFSRGPVLNVGLLGSRAVAGNDPGFTGNLMFVGNDRRIYELAAYTPTPVSTPFIESLLQQVDPDDLEASVYSVNGHSCWVLTSPLWTLVCDQSTGNNYHERMSIGTTRWRATGCINAFNMWLAFERGSNEVYIIDPAARREDADQLVFEVRSNQTHRFPGRFAVIEAAFDMVYGVGNDRGISPIETDPVVSISWSDDGGRTFGNALLRGLGTQGENRAVIINRAGETKRQGRQWRLQVADPVEAVLMGGAMNIEPRS